jgi:hypothetical protein
MKNPKSESANVHKRQREFNVSSHLKFVYKASQCTDLNDIEIALRDCKEIASKYCEFVNTSIYPPKLRNRIRSLNKIKKVFLEAKRINDLIEYLPNLRRYTKKQLKSILNQTKNDKSKN